MTKKKFDQLGIPYREIPLEGTVLNHVRSLGYATAPVVEADFGEGVTTSWSGFRPSQIEQLKATL